MQPHEQSASSAKSDESPPPGSWLVAGGAMGERIRAHPWQQTPLGPLSAWSSTLRTATNLILAAPVPMALLWGDELTVLFNDAYAALAVERDADPLGRPARIVWADTLEVVGPIYDHVLSGGDALEFKDQHFRVRRSGVREDAWFNLAYAGVRGGARETTRGVLVIVQETTRYLAAERRLQENQQLLRNIVDSTPEIVFALDRDQRYTLVNDAIATFTGRRKDELIGQSPRSIYPPEMSEMLYRTNSEIMRTGSPMHNEVVLAPLGARQPRTLLVTRFALRGAGGEITGVGGVATDITERKQMEDEWRQQKTRAEESARMKATFLDIAAHELRTPITILSLLLQLYEDDVRDAGAISAVELARLREPVDRLSRLVVDLLNVARLERGMVVLQRRPTDLCALVDSVVAEFRVLAPDREFVVTTPAVPVVVDVDPVRLNQVIANLLDNARKYAPTGPIEVRLSTTPTATEIAVVDHGPGIAAASIEGLFDAFSRGSAGLVDDGSNGLGLGLSVCKGIVALHGGTIGVHSEPGRGCTFVVALPPARAAESPP